MSVDFHHDAVESMVTIHVPARTSYLGIIRKSVLDLCARGKLSELASSQLEMAVDESCSNIIEQSYDPENEPGDEVGPGQGIKINLILLEDRLLVEVFEFGTGFVFHRDTLSKPSEYLDREQSHGLGLYIINRFVDEVEYHQDAGLGNCLRLIKYR